MVTNPSSFVNSSRERSLSSTLSYPSLRRNLHLFTLSPIPCVEDGTNGMRALQRTHISDGTLLMGLQYDPFRSVMLVLLPFFFSVDLFCRFPFSCFLHTYAIAWFFTLPILGRLERCSRAAFVRSLLLRLLLRYTIGA